MFYRVNMANLSVTKKEEEIYKGLAGRALTSRIVKNEVDATAHALGKLNKLIFAPGYLTGTFGTNAGRSSFGAKSPLSGTIKESNVGGFIGHKVARCGVSALIIEDLPANDNMYTIKITKDSVTLEECNELKGLDIYDATAKLQEKYGTKIGVAVIGTAGENKMASACIGATDMDGEPTRQAGRGGLGAVMGSKGVKAIVVDDAGADNVPVVDKEAFLAGSRKLAKALTTHAVTGNGLPTYGTNILINILNEAGALPTRNFTDGRFEGHDKVSGETMYETIKSRNGNPTHGCSPACVIRCSQIYNDKDGNVLTGGFEYETCWGFGPNLGIDNLDDIALMNRLCDDYGIDTIEAAVTLGVAMDAGLAKFGDGKAAIEFIRQIGKATPLGRILGAGAEVTGKTLGVSHVPTVKGQGIPAYDPRAVKGVGVTYATSTMGADHTAGYVVATNILGVSGKTDPLSKEGQVDLSRNFQIATAFIDTSGLCLFVAFAILDIAEGMEGIVEMCNARYGVNKTLDDYLEVGKQVLRDERAFNKAAGIGEDADDLPDFFRNEKLPPHQVLFDIEKEELKKVFNF